jgi:hypothetical protein
MSYASKFIDVIQAVEHDNTYRLAFARALLEAAVDGVGEEQGDKIVFNQYDIVQRIMRYYWNMVAFFDLSQGPSSALEARIDEIASEFYGETGLSYRVWYDKVEAFLKRNPIRFERQVAKFITLFHKGVAGKFKVQRTDKLELFELDAKLKVLRLAPEHVAVLKDQAELLETLIVHQWAKLLEDYNKAPNLIKKVIGAKEEKIRRPNLIKYRNLLLQYDHLEGITDFYTGEHIELEDISLEHVIPFHFIYTVDIWNLIIVSKETAKARRGTMPTPEDIDRLNERNRRLFDAIEDTKLSARFELERALEEHLLDRYYIDLKG